MSRKCTPLWREAHKSKRKTLRVQIGSTKANRSANSWDVSSIRKLFAMELLWHDWNCCLIMLNLYYINSQNVLRMSEFNQIAHYILLPSSLRRHEIRIGQPEPTNQPTNQVVPLQVSLGHPWTNWGSDPTRAEQLEQRAVLATLRAALRGEPGHRWGNASSVVRWESSVTVSSAQLHSNHRLISDVPCDMVGIVIMIIMGLWDSSIIESDIESNSCLKFIDGIVIILNGN